MRSICVLLISMCFTFISAQEGCKQPKALKHDYYEPVFASEHAGVYLNAHNIANGRVQVELNTIPFELTGSYTSPVNSNILAVRYGVTNKFEAHLHSSHMNPAELYRDTLYNSSMSIGIKYELIQIFKQKFHWKASVRTSGSIYTSTQYDNSMQYPLGFDASIDNSLSYLALLHFDLSLGVYSLYSIDPNIHVKMSSRVMLKNTYSKIGLFLGISGDQYFESIVNLGFEITNNKRYTLLLTVGFLDNGPSPNVAFTYLF